MRSADTRPERARMALLKGKVGALHVAGAPRSSSAAVGDILIEFCQQASEVIQMGGIDFHDANSMTARFDVSFRPHVVPVLRGRHIGFHALHLGAKLRWNVHLFSAIHTVVQPKLLPSPHPHAAEFGLPLGRRARALALFF